ncbi:sodium/potassium-transporting ATPase subunit beta-like [Artemia franciscana]|uniref:Uncharacterized protein n=1 Tax=Artemia franciscana TaxID=6661 RepID=A0AA88HG10_ARTSF|nr:hypothetical protein QYM36_014149 [Artemia franciscana]
MSTLDPTDKSRIKSFGSKNSHSILKSVSTFIWNGETKEFMSRTVGSWALIIIYYVCLYIFLVGFAVGLFKAFLWARIDTKTAFLRTEHSLIGTTPGLTIRPTPEEENHYLIEFTRGNNGNWQEQVRILEDFIKPYEEQIGLNYINPPCDFLAKSPEKICKFDIGDLGNHCTKENKFGYEQGQPCVFVKLNKILDWTPIPYTKGDELPADMPDDLKQHIGTTDKEHAVTTVDSKWTELRAGPKWIGSTRMIWLSCQGKTPNDKVNIDYLPFRGFPAYYYPYRFIPERFTPSPLVALKLDNLQPGKETKIHCKAWAKNINHDYTTHLGYVNFKIKIHEPKSEEPKGNIEKT